jgi:hypothetical protein
MNIRSTLIHRRRPCCPMCDALGFKQDRRDFFGDPVLKCNSCGHEWISKDGKPGAQGTDRRQG